MFKGLKQSLAGTADICSATTDASKLAARSYVLPGEDILFAFQSAKEEFVFTNEALITVKAENAMTTRTLVQRYEYRECSISDVQFETTGRLDRDCEIKFVIGSEAISIDIARKEEEAVKVYYKALVALSREQSKRQRMWQVSKDGMAEAAKEVKFNGLTLADRASAGTDEFINRAAEVSTRMSIDFDRLNGRCYKAAITSAIQSA